MKQRVIRNGSSDKTAMRKRLLSVAFSLALLAALYTRVDIPALGGVLGQSDSRWMLVSLGMFVPLTMLTSWRLQQLMPPGARLTFAEANRLILVASALNLALPSNMGQIVKACFLKERGHLGGALSLSLVLFEKTCDMVSLLLWCVLGLALYPKQSRFFELMTGAVALAFTLCVLLLGSRRFATLVLANACRIAPAAVGSKLDRFARSWEEMHGYFWGDRLRLTRIAGASVFIWFLHLVQIGLFIRALRLWVPFSVNLALSPLAILAGLLPLTFAGVGTRDAALLYLYDAYFSAPEAAALGLLCTLRYVLPALGGFPFLGQYLPMVQGIRKKPDST